MDASGTASARIAALAWYRRVVIVGVACNVALGIAGVVNPTALIALLGLDPATPLVWPRLAAFLLILLALFYIPGACAPSEKRFEAIHNVVCRIGGVVFFLVIGGPYLIFGLYDLAFGLPQALLLWRGLSAVDAGKA